MNAPAGPRAPKAAAALALVGALASAPESLARWSDPTMERPGDARLVKALHLPTGCVARMWYEDGAFLRAEIVDRACLPVGVRARVVPGSAHDFVHIP